MTTKRDADALTIADLWSAINKERGRLIELNVAGNITELESKQLDALQAYAAAYLETFEAHKDAALETLEERLKAESKCIERGSPLPRSLFRRNLPISRADIDAAIAKDGSA